MEKLKYTLFVIPIFIFIINTGCKNSENYNKHNYYEYYNDGKIRVEADTIKGQFHGILNEYYENGLIKIFSNYINGKLNGIYIGYSINGGMEVNLNYNNGNLIGVQYNYHSKIPSIMSRKTIYCENRGKCEIVKDQEFDINGNIIREHGRVITKISKDTVAFLAKFSINFKLTYPEFNKTKVHIGKFDRSLKLIDSLNYKVYESKGHEISVNFIAKKRGKNVIRGYMEDYYIENTTDSTFSTIGTLNNWFDIEYFVK